MQRVVVVREPFVPLAPFPRHHAPDQSDGFPNIYSQPGKATPAAEAVEQLLSECWVRGRQHYVISEQKQRDQNPS